MASHILIADDGTQAFVFINGQRWAYRRKLVQTTIVNLCATKYISQVLNKCMVETVFRHLESIIAENNNEWEDSRNILSFLAFNTVYFANFGRSVKMNDPFYSKLLKLLEEGTNNIPYECLQDFIPWIGYLYPTLAPKVIQTRVERTKIIEQLICERNNEMKSYHSNENYCHKASYIDNSSIEVQQKRLTKGEQNADTFLLFAAGVETTSATLEFAVALLANNIKIQNEVREELERTATEMNGKYKTFDARKLNKLVSFRALVYETLRIASALRRTGNSLIDEDIWISIAENEPKMLLPAGSLVFNTVEYINSLSTSEKWLNIKTGDEEVSGLQLCLENWIHTDIETGQLIFVMNPSFVAFGIGKKN